MNLTGFNAVTGWAAKLAGFCVVTLAASAQLLIAADLRQVININREWTFQLGDLAGAEAVKFDDAQWERIGLPHSFSRACDELGLLFCWENAFWGAAGFRGPWLIVDWERVVTVSQVKLVFPTEDTRSCRVEISDDGNSGWRLVADESQNASRARVAALSTANGARGRFLRMQFIGASGSQPATLAEVEAQGQLVTQ